MAIIRKDLIKEAVGYSAREPKIDENGQLTPGTAVYEAVCDTKSDLLTEDIFAPGSMAYVRMVASGEQRRIIKVADTGDLTDWEPVDLEASGT